MVPLVVDAARVRVFVALALGIVLALMMARTVPDGRPGARLTSGMPAPLVVNSRPEIVRDTLQAQATDVWVFRFSGLIPARLNVETTRAGDVSCRLFDPDGRPVRRAQSAPSACRLAWIPARTGAYRIEITNRRDWETAYTVIVN